MTDKLSNTEIVASKANSKTSTRLSMFSFSFFMPLSLGDNTDKIIQEVSCLETSSFVATEAQSFLRNSPEVKENLLRKLLEYHTAGKCLIFQKRTRNTSIFEGFSNNSNHKENVT